MNEMIFAVNWRLCLNFEINPRFADLIDRRTDELT